MKFIWAFFICYFFINTISADELKQRYLNQFVNLSLEDLLRVKVFIASGTEQEIQQAPAVVTVITSEDIKRTGATNLTDILESVPGIHIRANLFANRPIVQMRGANGRQTLLMVNGNPMKDLVWGFGIFWKGLPVSMIKRIEVIRGPGSALYGADATAGVINVITKTKHGIENSELGGRLGSFDTQTAWFQYGGNWNDFDVGLTADFYKTDGHAPFIKADGQTRQDNSLGTMASYAPDEANYGWKNADIRFSIAKNNWQFMANYMKHSDLETGMTGAGILDPVTEGSDRRYGFDLIYNDENFYPDLGVDFKIHYHNLDYTSGNGFQEFPPGAFAGDYPDGVINQMRSAERQLGGQFSALYDGIKRHQWRIGVGYSWQDLYKVEQLINRGTGPDGNSLPVGSPVIDISDTPYAFAPERERKIRYLFVQDIWTIADDWELTAGLRYDNYSDFGDTINPRLALVWNSTENLTTKLLYGRAFRAPSFLELYADTSRALANSNLDPERSETLELVLSYTPSAVLQLDLTLFQLTMEDFIRALPSGQSLPQFQNTGTHNTLGFEIEMGWQVTRSFDLMANYTYRKPDNNEFRVVDQPKQQAYLRLDWAFIPNWNWNIQSNWVADRERSVRDSRDNLDDYIITDTTLRYNGSKDWELAASIRNIFDQDAREHTGGSVPNDFPLPERNLYAEVRYKF